jgi:class 3 adenylate cyclase
MSTDEEGTNERLKTHRRELVDPKIGEHSGRIIKTTGDGLLAEFPRVVDAVRCAAELQRAIAHRDHGIGRHNRRVESNAQLPPDPVDPRSSCGGPVRGRVRLDSPPGL